MPRHASKPNPWLYSMHEATRRWMYLETCLNANNIILPRTSDELCLDACRTRKLARGTGGSGWRGERECERGGSRGRSGDVMNIWGMGSWHTSLLGLPPTVWRIMESLNHRNTCKQKHDQLLQCPRRSGDSLKHRITHCQACAGLASH